MQAPTDAERLKKLAAIFEIATTDGDLSALTADDIGDTYQWLLWAANENRENWPCILAWMREVSHRQKTVKSYYLLTWADEIARNWGGSSAVHDIVYQMREVGHLQEEVGSSEVSLWTDEIAAAIRQIETTKGE